jgi:geranylgeranyl reductase family protein
MEKFDVAVIGSGPSGASAAFHLAQKGLKTVIIEKEFLPRYKTCGGGFVFRGRKSMSFDISSVVEREFNTVDILFDSKKLHFKTQRNEPIISMIMRDSFDHLIVKEAEKLGVTLLQGHKVENISMGDYATIQTNHGNVEARFVIAADGALSPVAKMAGWSETRMMCPALEYEIKVPEADFERLSTSARFDIDAVPYGYGWSFPKKNHLSVGVGCFMKNSKKINLKAYYQDYLKTIGIETVLEEQAHGFIIPISPRTDGFVKGNVFLIGDAAGFADPVTAEGISNAILSGALVAEAIAESNSNLERAAKIYQEKLDEKLVPELQTGVTLAKIFYENKNLRNLLLKGFGQQLSETMTDIFMGERSYPKDIKASIKRKVKNAIF